MQQQVQAAIDSVKGKHSEKRSGHFQVQGRFENGTVTLSGRVLEKAALADLRRAIEARVPAAQIDDSAVRVLRRQPAIKKIVATNVTDLHAEASFLSELLTQVLNGQVLEILEEMDSWCYVRQDDGYLGWAYSSYFQEMNSDAPKATHMVTAPAVQLLMDQSEEAAIATCLLCGTALVVQETKGQWAYVEPAGGLLAGGWMPTAELRPLESMKVAKPAEQITADARQLVGVYYLWGGATPFGMDCSALAQLTHRLSGFEIPRDAYMQFAKGKPVDPPYQSGDLLFFHSDADKQRITHVGISLGGWDMIHSSRAKNGVYEENVQSTPRLRDTFAGARTFIR